MKRRTLSVSLLPAWAQFNNITVNGIAIQASNEKRGSAVVATRSLIAPEHGFNVLMTVPKELILSVENVTGYAKSDRHLREVLEAMGEWGRTARGAILIFLLLQITNEAEDVTETVGVRNPWTEYVTFLPSAVPLPTFWSASEQLLLDGTSLASALPAKLKSLEREFQALRTATENIPWCRRQWWDEETGRLTLEDWKVVDAMFRSRALELPDVGDVMVPYLDMVNHASGEETVAVSKVDPDGNGALLLREGKTIKDEEEITITYGDDKGACEMVFSYGFIEDNMLTARELFLELEIPDDDPLKKAKMAVSTTAPGFKLYMKNEVIKWEGSFIWLICVNEEDGLEFKLLQTNNNDRELKVFWKNLPLESTSDLSPLLEKDLMWPIFQLRAITILQSRIESSILRLNASQEVLQDAVSSQDVVDASVLLTIARLRNLEMNLLETAWGEFEIQKTGLMNEESVRKYLDVATLEMGAGVEEDFS